MSAPASEGGQDDDDILGFPGNGFVDKTDANPRVLGEQDEEGDDTRIDETGGASSQDSVKKRKKSTVVAPDGHMTDRIKDLKQKITGSKREDNEWTKMLRAKLDHQTVDEKLGGDRTFKEQGGSLSSRKTCPSRGMCPLHGYQVRSGDKEGAQSYARSGSGECLD